MPVITFSKNESSSAMLFATSYELPSATGTGIYTHHRIHVRELKRENFT